MAFPPILQVHRLGYRAGDGKAKFCVRCGVNIDKNTILGIPKRNRSQPCNSVPGGIHSMAFVLLKPLKIMARILVYEPP
jgi:hypothetical protein